VHHTTVRSSVESVAPSSKRTSPSQAVTRMYDTGHSGTAADTSTEFVIPLGGLHGVGDRDN